MPARAVFFTWRTYGSWLPGDERGWVDEQHNAYGSATKWPDPRIHEASKAQMRSLAVELSPQQRIAVDAAIRETCSALGWPLIALNVRTNHVHVVLGADDRPAERVLTALKAHTTKALRSAGMVDGDSALWARGGSHRFLMDDERVEAAVDYVLNRQ